MKISDAKLQGLTRQNAECQPVAESVGTVRRDSLTSAHEDRLSLLGFHTIPTEVIYTMMKRIFPLLLAALFCIAAAIPTLASAEDSVATKAQVVSGVSFRDQPSTSGELMRYLKTGETVTVIGQPTPYWYQIQDQQGVTGYVSSNEKYIRVTSNAQIIYGVNFRTAPSSTAERIRMLAAGEDMLVLAKVNDYWYKAQDAKGTVGYVSSSSKYITVNNGIYKMSLPLDERIEAFINQGMSYMGTPYDFGSDRFNTATFDCSDFVQQSFWDVTRDVIPGDSRAQADYVKSFGPVESDWRNLKRGDLMFFMSYKGYRASDYSGIDESTETVTHVAIYLGNGQMLHTYSPESGGVRVDTIGGNTWEYRYLYGGSFTK